MLERVVNSALTGSKHGRHIFCGSFLLPQFVVIVCSRPGGGPPPVQQQEPLRVAAGRVSGHQARHPLPQDKRDCDVGPGPRPHPAAPPRRVRADRAPRRGDRRHVNKHLRADSVLIGAVVNVWNLTGGRRWRSVPFTPWSQL